MSRVASATLSLALLIPSPVSAQKLKGFEGQFLKGGSEAGRKVLEAVVETSAKLVEVGAQAGNSEAASTAGHILLLPVYPLTAALSMERKSQGEQRLSVSGHHVDDRVRGWGGSYRYSAANHLHYEAFWMAYLEEAAPYDLHFIGARVAGDVVEDEHGRLEYGLGIAGLAGRRHRGGPDFSLGLELTPRRSLFLDAHAGAVVLEGGTLGDLRAGAGFRWGRVELRAGYRALVGPFATLGGPELGFSVRL